MDWYNAKSQIVQMLVFISKAGTRCLCTFPFAAQHYLKTHGNSILIHFPHVETGSSPHDPVEPNHPVPGRFSLDFSSTLMFSASASPSSCPASDYGLPFDTRVL